MRSQCNRKSHDRKSHSANSRRTRLASEAGLTLIEIIIVLVILGVLLSFLASRIFGQGENAKARINAIKMNSLKGYIDQYQLMYNALPGDLRALVGCNEQTGQACIPIAGEDDLKDVWGTPFIYSSDGQRSYTLKSLGSDRRDGGSGVEGDPVIKGP